MENPFELFEGILDNIEKAVTPFEPAIEAAEAGATALAPIIAAAVPTLAPEIAIVTAAVTKGRAIIAAASPELKEFAAIFSGLAHATPTPQAVVVTPKTTLATTPATGNALS